MEKTDKKLGWGGWLVALIIVSFLVTNSAHNPDFFRFLLWVGFPLLSIFAAYEQFKKGSMLGFFCVWLCPSLLSVILFGIFGFIVTFALGVFIWLIAKIIIKQ